MRDTKIATRRPLDETWQQPRDRNECTDGAAALDKPGVAPCRASAHQRLAVAMVRVDILRIDEMLRRCREMDAGLEDYDTFRALLRDDDLLAEHLRASELAKYLGISKATLAKQRCTGEGIRFSRLGRCVVCAADDVEAYLRDRTRGSTSEGPISQGATSTTRHPA
jgi:hypothetical protein